MRRRLAAAPLLVLGLLLMGWLAWLALEADPPGPLGPATPRPSVGAAPPAPAEGARTPRRPRVRLTESSPPMPAETAQTRGKGGAAPSARVAVVVDEAGVPVPGAIVEVTAGERSWTGPAGGDGRFPRSAADGTGRIAIRARAAGFSETSTTFAQDESWIVVLRGTHALAGRVLDADGRGVADASVTVVPAGKGDYTAQERTWSTETDTAGGFRVEQLPPGDFVVSADVAATHARPGGHAQVKCAADTLDAELRLEVPRRIEGRVVDEAGRPFEGKLHVVMRAVKPNGDAGSVWTGTLSDDARFVVDGVDSARNVLWAWMDDREAGFAMTVLRDLAPGRRTVDVVLKPGRVIRARIVDDRGEVLPGNAHWYVLSDGNDVLNSAIATKGEIVTHPLPYDGRYDLIVYHEAGWTGSVEDVRPGTTDLVVAMHRSGAVSGSLLLPDGSPAGAGLIVRARALTLDNRMRTGLEQRAETDEKGRFQIGGLADVPFTVSAWPSTHGYAPVRAPGEHLPGSDVTLRLAHGAALSGELRDAAGRPVAKRRLWLLPAADASWSLEVRTDEKGSFRAAALPPDAIRVVLAGPDEDLLLGTFRAPAKDVRLTLPAGR